MKCSQCCRAMCGFTLLELLVVVAIVSMVTATVTTRIADTLGPAALKQSVSQLSATDQAMRQRTRRSGRPASLHFEIGTSRLECEFDDATGAPRTIRTLGRGVRISKFLSATQEVGFGTARINYDGRGASESFAIELAGRGEARRWLLIAGLTGQIIEITHEASAHEILQTLLPARLHAG